MKHTNLLRKVAVSAALTAALCVFASAEDIKLGIGTVTASSLRLRKEATTSSQILTSAPKGDKVVLLENVGNNWYKVNYDQNIGYMHADYLEIDTVKNIKLGSAVAKECSVNMRAKPTTKSELVHAVPLNGEVEVIGFNEGWYKVEYKNATGYIRSDLMTLVDEFPCNGNSNMTDLVDYCKRFLGTPYVWGGTTPNPGFDCSGFTQYVCKHFGVTINRVAVDQMLNGVSVSYNNLRVGDLVFFERTYQTTAAASHVGFYIGEGKFIHAANAGIKISSLSENYYATRYVGARRVF